MRKFITLILVSYTSVCAFCQVGMRFSLGYNAMIPASKSVNDLNFIYRRYNETRSFLTKTLGPVKYLGGMHYKFTFGIPGFVCDVAFSGGRHMQYAEGIGTSGDLERRYMKTRCSNLEAGFAYAPSGVSSPWLIGVSAESSNLILWTRAGELAEVKSARWLQPCKVSTLSLGVYARFQMPTNPAAAIELYLKRDVAPGSSEYGLLPLNIYLNKNTYLADPQNLKWTSHHMGFRVLFAFGGDR